MDRFTPSSDSERRVVQRVPAALKVEYKFDSNVAQSVTADISESGIFLVTAKPALAGTKVYLRLEVKPGTPPIKIIGIVRRKVDEDQARPPGMGIQFEVVYAHDINQLRGFVNETLGLKVPDAEMAPVSGGKAYKHVMPGAAKAAGKPPPAMSKGAKPAQTRKKVRDEDREALRKLNFSYDTWMLQRVLKYALYVAIPVGIFFGVRAVISALNSLF